MRSVLVSGPAPEANALATALRQEGYETFGFDLPPSLGTAADGEPPAGPVDCYVQLAPAGDGPGAGSPTRALLRRVEAVSLVSPLLAWDATVLIVAEDCDRRRREALRLMAEAALSDAGREDAHVVLVLDEGCARPCRSCRRCSDPEPSRVAGVRAAFGDIVNSFGPSPA